MSASQARLRLVSGWGLPVFSGLVLLLAQSSPAAAQGVTAESLRGRTITAQVAYETRARREGREFDNPVKFNFVITIAGDGRVTGTTSRTAQGPRGPVSESRTWTAMLGKPREIVGGHSLVVLIGNTLTLLRTFEVGGVKTTITLRGGSGCSIRAPLMREVGAGPVRRDAIVGGTIELLSSRQVSSSCQVR
jgi:hypothetical protein